MARKKPAHGGKRTGAGRPLTADEPRSLALMVRVTPSERDALKARAASEGVTCSDLARKALGLK